MTIEQAKKMIDEEYEKAKRLEFVNDTLAYALFAVWKKADAERRKNASDNRKGIANFPIRRNSKNRT